jgi:hypothetical protein
MQPDYTTIRLTLPITDDEFSRLKDLSALIPAGREFRIEVCGVNASNREMRVGDLADRLGAEIVSIRDGSENE